VKILQQRNSLLSNTAYKAIIRDFAEEAKFGASYLSPEYTEERRETEERFAEIRVGKRALFALVDKFVPKKKYKKTYPKYVSLDGTALRLRERNNDNIYYRPAGCWAITFKRSRGVLVATGFHVESCYGHVFPEDATVKGKVLQPISKEVFDQDNKGYV
jgi:hypothetical protein